MFRKIALGLVAAASLSAVALVPSTASAKGGWGGGWGGWGGGHHHHFHGFGPGIGIGYVGYDDGGCYVTRRVATPYGYRLRTINVCD